MRWLMRRQWYLEHPRFGGSVVKRLTEADLINPSEREAWFKEYLRAGTKFAETRGTAKQVRAWAKSMSLIAEQFTGNNEGEPADPQPVS